MSDEKKQSAPKSVEVALRGPSRGHKAGDRVKVSQEKADALLRDGLADPA